MQITSLSFLYLFLPGAIALCLLTPPKARPAALLLLSALFYGWLEGKLLFLLAGILLFDYFAAYFIRQNRGNRRLCQGILLVSIVKNAGLLVVYGVLEQVRGVHTPLGLGVVCLTCVGYTADYYFDLARPERGLMEFALTACFFPRLYAGPIAIRGRMTPHPRGLQMTLEKIGRGGRIFLRGMAKKIILGNTIYAMFVKIKAVPYLNMTSLTAWTLVLTMALASYFILSGYCDMARGLGLIFGLELPDNFRYPFGAHSVNDFLARFNSTVNRFFRHYVYFPLGGAQGSVPSGIFNSLLATILMGLWFGIRLNLLIWGLYLALFVIFERYIFSRYLDLIAPLFRWLYTTAAVLVSFAFYSGDTLTQSFGYLKLMFGLTAFSPYNADILYLLASNYLVLILAAVSSAGLLDWLSTLLHRSIPRVWEFVLLVYYFGLLVVVTAFLL